MPAGRKFASSVTFQRSKALPVGQADIALLRTGAWRACMRCRTSASAAARLRIVSRELLGRRVSRGEARCLNRWGSCLRWAINTGGNITASLWRRVPNWEFFAKSADSRHFYCLHFFFTATPKNKSLYFINLVLVYHVQRKVESGERKPRIPSGIEGWAGSFPPLFFVPVAPQFRASLLFFPFWY
jgi:hypothetical protein